LNLVRYLFIVSIWKPHKRLISQAFHTRMLGGFFDTFNRKNQEALARLQIVADTNKVMDLWDHLSLVSFDMLCG